MTLLLASIELDVTQVYGFILIFFCYLGGIDISGRITSLSTFLTLFKGLGLRLISKREVIRLSLFFVFIRDLITMCLIGIIFIFLNQQFISFQVSRIDLPSLGGWLQIDLCFYINNFFYYLSHIFRSRLWLSNRVQMNRRKPS